MHAANQMGMVTRLNDVLSTTVELARQRSGRD
jgi:hypothetical protein